MQTFVYLCETSGSASNVQHTAVIYGKIARECDPVRGDRNKTQSRQTGMKVGVISALVYLFLAHVYTRRALWSRTCSGQGPCTHRRYTSGIIRRWGLNETTDLSKRVLRLYQWTFSVFSVSFHSLVPVFLRCSHR